MASTYVPIATTTLGSAQSSVSFNSFSGYTDLYIVVNARNTTNGAACKIQFNGDTGSNYSTTWLEGNSGGAVSGRASNDTAGFVYYNGGAFTNNWSTANVNIQNYSNSTTNKTVITRFGNIAQTGAYVNLWRNTAAITSITLVAITENFQSGSTFTIYGIKAA